MLSFQSVPVNKVTVEAGLPFRRLKRLSHALEVHGTSRDTFLHHSHWLHGDHVYTRGILGLVTLRKSFRSCSAAVDFVASRYQYLH